MGEFERDNSNGKAGFNVGGLTRTLPSGTQGFCPPPSIKAKKAKKGEGLRNTLM